MPAPPAPLLSLCMIVRNEERHLARCLASVRDVVDEMIIVDTGSTDGTPAIARSFGATVIVSPWQDDFSQARNVGLAHARGRWILCLDADETLLGSDIPALRDLLARSTPAGAPPDRAFQLLIRNGAEGARTAHTAAIIRLFPNRPEIRFEWRIHEQVGTSLQRANLPIEPTTITLLHTGYSDPAAVRGKQRRNRDLLLRQIAAEPDATPLTFFLLAGCYLDLGESAAALLRYDEARGRATHAPEVARGATVRMVTCLIALGRHRDALALMPHPLDGSAHPETVLDRATIALVLEGRDAARSHYERVLACADRPEIPTCDVGALKIEALKFLGAYWHGLGRRALALHLLRRALAINAEGRDVTIADLAACYRENGVSTPPADLHRPA